MLSPYLARAIADLNELTPRLASFDAPLTKLADAALACWSNGGKILTAGNGGSLCDAMHLAEELVARFQKNRRALPAMALADPAIITCAGNDFGYETIFSRQVEAFGKPGDLLIVFSTSGNSPNILRALSEARQRKLLTAAFLGRDGGKAKGLSDIELVIPAQASHRIQECHQILYHTLCEYIDSIID